MNPDDDLQAELEGEDPDYTGPIVPPSSERRAAGMLWRIRRAREDYARYQATATRQHEQVNTWLARHGERLASQEAWLLGSLRRFHEAVLTIRPGALSVDLGPAGKLTSRMGQPEWVVDNDKLRTWALPQPAAEAIAELHDQFLHDVAAILDEQSPAPRALAIRPPGMPDVSRSGLKEAFTRHDDAGNPVAWGITENGEQVPGVEVKPAERIFDVKLPPSNDDAGEIEITLEESA